MKKILCLVLALVMILAFTACGAKEEAPAAEAAPADKAEEAAPADKAEEAPADAEPYVIGVSPLTTQHEYYITYLEGIKAAAEKRGVKVEIVDPSWDVAKQVSDIEDFVAKKVDAIICSPTNPEGVKAALVSAEEAGVPVLVEMTLIEGVYPLIGTNQYDGAFMAGVWAGEWANKYNDGKGKAALLDYPYFQNCRDRAKGYQEGLASVAPGVEWVTAIDCGANMEGALKVAEDILQANPDINIMFGINGDSAMGADAAYESAGIDPAKVCVVGFDAGAGERKLMEDGKYVKCSVAADGIIIGECAIDAAIRKIEGEDLGEWVEVDAAAQYLVTVDNIADYPSGK
jgi:ribose transport system substrate-binding protein